MEDPTVLWGRTAGDWNGLVREFEDFLGIEYVKAHTLKECLRQVLMRESVKVAAETLKHVKRPKHTEPPSRMEPKVQRGGECQHGIAMSQPCQACGRFFGLGFPIEGRGSR